jgi:large subunit ribosomal protein L1
MAFVGKRLRNIQKKFDKEAVFTLEAAVKFLKENAAVKFDETLEISMNLNVDPRKADQNIRGMLSLPHGTGKICRVAVFARGPKAEEAKEAGADLVGAEDLMESIQKGEMNFDRCIATPDMMAVVGRLGKVLGPRGLMPNPKLGTVTMDVASAIKAAKGGQVEYRTEKNGIVHAGIGKCSFNEQALLDNAKAFIDTVTKARPTGVKGKYIKKISVSTTMGPGLTLQDS